MIQRAPSSQTPALSPATSAISGSGQSATPRPPPSSPSAQFSGRCTTCDTTKVTAPAQKMPQPTP